MNPHLQTIEANLPGLGNPSTCASAVAAIDTAYTQVWRDVSNNVLDTCSLTALAAAARARNTLYRGHAASLLLRSLASAAGDAALREPGPARHLLGLLDKLCKPLHPELEELLQQALGNEHLISFDYSQLNVLRAQPRFVALAINTFLDLPDNGLAPNMSATYLLNLAVMDGTDHDTSTAYEELLRADSSREAIWRGLRSQTAPPLVIVVQLLKRCFGGKPGPHPGFQTFGTSDYPPFTLEELLELGAEQPLVAVCNRAAALCSSRPRDPFSSGLRTTLLNALALVSTPNVGQRSAAVGSGRAWPDALVTAHVQLVMQVLKRTPLGIELAHMRPYGKSPVASRAVEQLDANAMSAIVAVLAASDPSNTTKLKEVAVSYKIVGGLVSHSPQLAQRALEAGTTHTVLSHLRVWARLDSGAAEPACAALQLLKTLLKAPNGGLAALAAAGEMSIWTEFLSGMGSQEKLGPLVRECVELMRGASSSGSPEGGASSPQQGGASGSQRGGASAAVDSNTTTSSQQGRASSSQPGGGSSSQQAGASVGPAGIAEGGAASAQHDGNGAQDGRRRRVCAACNSSGAHLKRCTRCRAVWYCNATCQRLDWAVHKCSCVEPA